MPMVATTASERGVLDESALRARFFLLEVDLEGVLVDRYSGGVFRLNRTACGIWAALMRGASVGEIAATLVQRYGVATDRAEHDAHAALTVSERSGPSTMTACEPIPCRWEMTTRGYSFFDGGVVTCEIDRDGSWLRLPAGHHPSEGDARRRIRSVVARVLSLRGIQILHASAVGLKGALTVFTGRSGAGKTTTAQAFARAGAQLVSEDLLVLAGAEHGQLAVLGGEAVIRTWVGESAARLARNPSEKILCDTLDSCVRGDRRPIERVMIIEAGRRSGEQIQHDLLAPADALVGLLESVFFASWDAQTWYPPLAALRCLASEALISRATMPLGMEALDQAVRTYAHSEMIAS